VICVLHRADFYYDTTILIKSQHPFFKKIILSLHVTILHL